MNEELRKKIEKDIVKAGFYSEMQVIQTFLSCEWPCGGSYHYFDRDEGKTREVDIGAGFFCHQRGVYPPFGIYRIVGEVKKSEKPWVVFKQTDFQFRYEPPEILITFDKLPCEEKKLIDILSENNLGATLGWRGYGIHEFDKKPNQTSRWYSAFVTVAKCAWEVLDSYQQIFKEVKEDSKKENESEFSEFLESFRRFYWVQPVVILDGDLISVELDEKGEMHISEIEFVPFCFYFQTENYTRGSYDVDVVTLKALKSYIKLSEQWVLNLCKIYTHAGNSMK